MIAINDQLGFEALGHWLSWELDVADVAGLPDVSDVADVAGLPDVADLPAGPAGDG
jgi:hypothetical protein